MRNVWLCLVSSDSDGNFPIQYSYMNGYMFLCLMIINEKVLCIEKRIVVCVHKNRIVDPMKIRLSALHKAFGAATPKTAKRDGEQGKTKNEEMNTGLRFAFIGFPLSFSSLLRFSFVRAYKHTRIYRYTIAHMIRFAWEFLYYSLVPSKAAQRLLKPHHFWLRQKKIVFLFRFTVANIFAWACFWAPSS